MKEKKYFIMFILETYVTSADEVIDPPKTLTQNFYLPLKQLYKETHCENPKTSDSILELQRRSTNTLKECFTI